MKVHGKMQSYKKKVCRKSSAELTVIRTGFSAPQGISDCVSTDGDHAFGVVVLGRLRATLRIPPLFPLVYIVGGRSTGEIQVDPFAGAKPVKDEWPLTHLRNPVRRHA